MSSEKFDPNKDFLPSDQEDAKQKIYKGTIGEGIEGKIGTFDVTDVNYPNKTDTGKKVEEDDKEDNFVYKLGKGIGEFVKKGGESLSSFASTVGQGLSNVATYMPDKLDEVYKDKDRRRNFLIGLEIINQSSGYKPISSGKSPFGMITSGIQKGFEKERAFELKEKEAQAALIKAYKGPGRRYESPLEKAQFKIFEDYNKNFQDRYSKNIENVNQRFNLLYNLASKNKQPPTGLVENFLTPFQEIGNELFGKENNPFTTMISKYGGKQFGDVDSVTFKREFDAASKGLIIGLAKNLYPVSENDVNRLLESVGSVSTDPQALIRLVAAQKALQDIALSQNKLIGNELRDAVSSGRTDFVETSQAKGGEAVKAKYKDLVDPKLLAQIYGIEDISKASPFQIASAYYISQLTPKITSDKLSGSMDWLGAMKQSTKQETDDLTSKTNKILKNK